MRSEATFRQLVEYSVDTIFRMSPKCEILYVSPSVTRLLGYAPDELTGRIVFDLICEEDRHIALAAAKKSAEPGVESSPGTQRWMHKDGHTVWIEVNGRMVCTPEGLPHEIVIVTRDISERKALEEQLAKLAMTDSLTGLHNRRSFDELLEREWQRTLRSGSPTSLLLLDLDHFKQINDTYGHTVGDDCLRAAAQAVTFAVRRGTDLCARYGGEELAVILPDTDFEGAMQVGDNVRRAVHQLNIPHRENPEGDWLLSASIGVATALGRVGGTMRMPEALLQAADAALYRAKHLGRNRVEGGVLLTPAA